MARKSAVTEKAPSPSIDLNDQELARAIGRLEEAITAVEGFDLNTVRERQNPPAVGALEASISRALEKAFGHDTTDARRFASASKIAFEPSVVFEGYPAVSDFAESIKDSLANSKAMLKQAVGVLKKICLIA